MATNLTTPLHAATDSLQTALHEPTCTLTAPQLSDITSTAKPFYWMVPDLLDRLADQLAARITVGNLRDDRGPNTDPNSTAQEAIDALRATASAVRSSGHTWEAAHNALAHLADHNTPDK